MRVLGTSNLYWESYSGHFPDEKKTSPLQGVARFSIYILPFALVAFPTIAIYIWIIKVNIITLIYKQAGAELCQAQHSLSFELDTN